MKPSGFTLTETLIAVAIIGILSSIALPNYIKQVNRSRQNETISTITKIQSTIATFSDEYGVLPKSWADLNNTSAVMTNDGPASKEDFESITLPGNFYSVAITNKDNLFTITATRDQIPNLNIIACINLTNGASDIKKGTQEASATSPNCV